MIQQACDPEITMPLRLIFNVHVPVAIVAATDHDMLTMAYYWSKSGISLGQLHFQLPGKYLARTATTMTTGYRSQARFEV